MLRSRTALVLLLLATTLPALSAGVYRLEVITVGSAAAEYIHAKDKAGDSFEYTIARGRFYDRDGVPFSPGEALERGDRLVVVVRANDASRTILSAIRCSEKPGAGAASKPAMAAPHRAPSGLTFTVATGWMAESEGDMSAVLYRKDPTAFLRIDRVVPGASKPDQKDGMPADLDEDFSMETIARDTVDFGGHPFDHVRSAALMESDRGMAWFNLETGAVRRSASPIHSLWLVDAWEPQEKTIPSFRAVSVVAVADYPSRIREVQAMMASLQP